MNKYAVLGQHIQYSRSPQIHLASAHYLRLKIEYTILDYSPDDLNRFLTEEAYFAYSGLNVTTPYKELLARHFKSPNSSINTIKIDQNHVQTYSTDAYGFQLALNRVKINLTALKHVYFLGNGGATTALIAFLSQHFPHLKFYVLRRNPEKDDGFLMMGVKTLNFCPKELQACLYNEESSLIVQACLPRAPIAAFMQEIQRFKGIFFDLNYNQPSLETLATKLGIRYQAGLPMLLGQAIAAQNIWWGQSASFDFLMNELTSKGAL